GHRLFGDDAAACPARGTEAAVRLSGDRHDLDERDRADRLLGRWTAPDLPASDLCGTHRPAWAARTSGRVGRDCGHRRNQSPDAVAAVSHGRLRRTLIRERATVAGAFHRAYAGPFCP